MNIDGRYRLPSGAVYTLPIVRGAILRAGNGAASWRRRVDRDRRPRWRASPLLLRAVTVPRIPAPVISMSSSSISWS
jgi:hypothetical protein